MIYAASDLHGDLIAFNKLKEYIEKDVDYHLIYLGDAADRGESGYKIIKWLLENDRAIYIKGNHEQIFILAALEFYKIKSRYLKNKTLEEIISNYSISYYNSTSDDIYVDLANSMIKGKVYIEDPNNSEKLLEAVYIE